MGGLGMSGVGYVEQVKMNFVLEGRRCGFVK